MIAFVPEMMAFVPEVMELVSKVISLKLEFTGCVVHGVKALPEILQK